MNFLRRAKKREQELAKIKEGLEKGPIFALPRRMAILPYKGNFIYSSYKNPPPAE
jgi:hypothetical protein